MTIITQVRSEPATETPRARTVDMKLEVVTLPVSDINHAKKFYGVSGGGSTPTSARATNS